MTKTERVSAAPLPKADRARLQQALDDRVALGIPVQTLARALAGMPVRAGTAALIRERIEAATAAARGSE